MVLFEFSALSAAFNQCAREGVWKNTAFEGGGEVGVSSNGNYKCHVSRSFSVITNYAPTLLIDEADTFMDGKSEMKPGVVNKGYEKGGFVLRVETVGKGTSRASLPCLWS